jgi:DNA-binding MarR family transcriptional regulator
LPEAAEPGTVPQDKPDAGLGRFIGYNLKRAHSVVQADLAGVLAGFDLRAVSYSALTVIVGQPGISQSELAEALRIERSNLVQLIDELSARGLLTRAPVKGDRRRHALMPTAEGIALAGQATGAVAEHEDRIFAGLTPAERAALIGLLQRVWT